MQRLTWREWSALLVLCGALFLDALDVSIKGVVLPAIGSELGLGPAGLQWVISGYSVGYAGFLLLGGRAADRLGRRRMFLWSLAAYAVISLVGGLAHDGVVLVAARVLAGVCAAFTAPAGISIITTTFADGPERERALSIYNAAGASGFALGLVAGGLLATVNWRWTFLGPAGLATLTVLAAVRMIPTIPRHRMAGGFDVAGAVLATAGLLLLILAITRASVIGLAASIVLLAGFVAREETTRYPLLNLRLLRSGPLVRANIGAMALLGAWIGTLFALTLHFEQSRGWSALQTGLAFVPTGLVVMVLAPRIVAPLVARYRATVVVSAGLGAAVLAYVWFLRAGGDAPYLLLLPAFLLVGLAFTLAYGPLTVAAISGAPAAEQGVASGLVSTSFQLGAGIVVAAVTAVEPAGLWAAFAVSLVVAMIGFAVVAVYRLSTPDDLARRAASPIE